MNTEWCVQIEPTQTPGRVLLVTTKAQLDIGQQWIDDNMPPIFQIYLPKNPEFVPDQETPIPQQADLCPPHATLDEFTDALRQKITIPHALSTKNAPFA